MNEVEELLSKLERLPDDVRQQAITRLSQKVSVRGVGKARGSGRGRGRRRGYGRLHPSLNPTCSENLAPEEGEELGGGEEEGGDSRMNEGSECMCPKQTHTHTHHINATPLILSGRRTTKKVDYRHLSEFGLDDEETQQRHNTTIAVEANFTHTHTAPTTVPGVKRGRGRPRKHPAPTPTPTSAGETVAVGRKDQTHILNCEQGSGLDLLESCLQESGIKEGHTGTQLNQHKHTVIHDHHKFTKEKEDTFIDKEKHSNKEDRFIFDDEKPMEKEDRFIDEDKLSNKEDRFTHDQDKFTKEKEDRFIDDEDKRIEKEDRFTKEKEERLLNEEDELVCDENKIMDRGRGENFGVNVGGKGGNIRGRGENVGGKGGNIGGKRMNTGSKSRNIGGKGGNVIRVKSIKLLQKEERKERESEEEEKKKEEEKKERLMEERKIEEEEEEEKERLMEERQQEEQKLLEGKQEEEEEEEEQKLMEGRQERRRKKVYVCDSVQTMDNISKKKSIKSELKCEVCGKMYSTLSILKTHQIRHLPKEELPFRCSSCPFTAASRIELSRHQNKHVDEHMYVCEVCGNTFSRDTTLREHIQFVHTKKQQFKCAICEFTTHRPSTMRKHLEGHTQVEPVVVCPVCGALFKSKRNLKAHLLSHAGAKPHACDECGKKFILQNRLAAHKLQVHAPRTHNCPHCIKWFPTVHHLRRHIRVHTGEKPFTCCFCTFSCNTQGNLIKHIRHVHDKINFSYKDYLRESGRGQREVKVEEGRLKELTEEGTQMVQQLLPTLTQWTGQNLTLDQLKQQVQKERDTKVAALREQQARRKRRVLRKTAVGLRQTPYYTTTTPDDKITLYAVAGDGGTGSGVSDDTNNSLDQQIMDGQEGGLTGNHHHQYLLTHTDDNGCVVIIPWDVSLIGESEEGEQDTEWEQQQQQEIHSDRQGGKGSSTGENIVSEWEQQGEILRDRQGGKESSTGENIVSVKVPTRKDDNPIIVEGDVVDSLNARLDLKPHRRTVVCKTETDDTKLNTTRTDTTAMADVMQVSGIVGGELESIVVEGSIDSADDDHHMLPSKHNIHQDNKNFCKPLTESIQVIGSVKGNIEGNSTGSKHSTLQDTKTFCKPLSESIQVVASKNFCKPLPESLQAVSSKNLCKPLPESIQVIASNEPVDESVPSASNLVLPEGYILDGTILDNTGRVIQLADSVLDANLLLRQMGQAVHDAPEVTINKITSNVYSLVSRDSEGHNGETFVITTHGNEEEEEVEVQEKKEFVITTHGNEEEGEKKEEFVITTYNKEDEEEDEKEEEFVVTTHGNVKQKVEEEDDNDVGVGISGVNLLTGEEEEGEGHSSSLVLVINAEDLEKT
ncbi:hypothetical protein Pmani_000292 [Petrolisthes manimaculis]|uniref:C2H2-type domain-containing protein n=1 Tax=Petrolisthes manimaculis TaxID=1843537 RepID=A0AAE1ULF5_9EUCA|nr:hypothetical protein Pmani_000292 [Petrolisthes manimaculis]